MPEPATPEPGPANQHPDQPAIAPRQCGGCRAPVIQAFTRVGRAVLLDYPPVESGAVAARIDPDAEVWRARFLLRHEAVPDTEVRFRQHSVTCTGQTADSMPILMPPDAAVTETATLEPLPEPGGTA
jgi:hypothetical protein